MLDLRGIVLFFFFTASISYASCGERDYYCPGFERWRALGAQVSSDLTNSILRCDNVSSCKESMNSAVRKLNEAQNFASAGHMATAAVSAGLGALVLLFAL